MLVRQARAGEARGEIQYRRFVRPEGNATTLKEIARQSQVRIELDENALPIQPAVAGACALLERMRRHAQGQGTALIGEVTEGPPGQVHLRTTIGGRRAIEMLAGEQLPRIC